MTTFDVMREAPGTVLSALALYKAGQAAAGVEAIRLHFGVPAPRKRAIVRNAAIFLIFGAVTATRAWEKEADGINAAASVVVVPVAVVPGR